MISHCYEIIHFLRLNTVRKSCKFIVAFIIHFDIFRTCLLLLWTHQKTCYMQLVLMSLVVYKTYQESHVSIAERIHKVLKIVFLKVQMNYMLPHLDAHVN